MNKLPIEVQRTIYEFDPTYRLVFNQIIQKDIPHCHLKRHPFYPYLLNLFIDMGYDYDNAIYYYTDHHGQPQISFIDDDFNNITDNFEPNGDIITYQGADITYLLEGYMTPDDDEFEMS
jgi:hypothetical protein